MSPYYRTGYRIDSPWLFFRLIIGYLIMGWFLKTAVLISSGYHIGWFINIIQNSFQQLPWLSQYGPVGTSRRSNKEQENHVPENRLSIYNRIVSFRSCLVENYTANTVANSISKIRTFYRYNRIRLPFIPPLNSNALARNGIISFADLPTKDEFRRALKASDDNIALWILVILSSGMTRAEAKSISNGMFFRWTEEHHKKADFKKAME